MNKILIGAGYFLIIIFKENEVSYFNSLVNVENRKKYYQFMLERVDKTYECVLGVAQRY